jgi:hypothetical protein
MHDNFRPGTPCDSIKRIHKICVKLQESGFRLPMGRDAYDLPLINEIQGNHVSGWIAFTMGGFSVTQLIDSGSDYPMCESERLAYENDLNQFCRLNNIDEYRDSLELIDEYRDSLEPSILEFRIWINKDHSIEWDYRVENHLISEGKLKNVS